MLVLKASMSSATVLLVISLFWQSVQCTVFPPVSDPPPIPGQDFRTLDISGQQFYVQDDLQGTPPQTVIKDDRFFNPTLELKPDDQWFISDNESIAGDFPTSSETYGRLYANGMPAIGPVATPPPDENYIAQSTGTSKIFPDVNSNLDSSILILTRGPNNQLVQERWMPIQAAPSKSLDVINAQGNSKILSGNLQTATPIKGLPVKSQGIPADPGNVGQQVWVRVPASASLQKGYPSVPTTIEDISSVKEVVDVPQLNIKQSFQPQIVKGLPNLPSLAQTSSIALNKNPAVSAIAPQVVSKSSSFVVPPPPPPFVKSSDKMNPKGTLVVPPTVSTILEKGSPSPKSPIMQQVKYVWVPTSQKTGNFITVPVGSTVNANQPMITKGMPSDAIPPQSLSQTWVLKDNGVVPRFEQQKSLFPAPVIGKEKSIVEETPVLVDSPNNIPTIGKSLDVVNQDIWPQRTEILDGKTLVKDGTPQNIFPPTKSDAIVVEKSVQIPPQSIQKGKVAPLLTPQPSPIIPQLPTLSLMKGKPPCPIMPQTLLQSKSFPYAPNLKRQPMARIIRINRYPFGSYYGFNPRIRSNFLSGPRQAMLIKQVNNRVVRLIPSSALPLTMPRRFSLPLRQVALPVTAGKSVTPRILYSPVPAVGRVRYAFPWGGYLSALPSSYGRNVLPTKFDRQTGGKSSSSSSSSESSESKEAPIKIKPKKIVKTKEKAKIVKAESEEKPVESVGSIETAEPESEPVAIPELDSAESIASAVESEAEEGETTEAETETEVETEAEVPPESLEGAESQFIPRIAPRPFLDFNYDNFKNLGQPYGINYEQRERPSTFLAQETPELGGRIVGRYTYKDQNGINRNIAYISDAHGYRSEILNNESNRNNQKIATPASLIKENNSQNHEKSSPETVTESLLPFNLAFDLQRD